MMDITEPIGILGATLTTLSFMPQFLQVARSRSVGDISPWTYLLFTVSLALWVVYGVAIGSWVLIVFDTAQCLLCAGILYYCVRYAPEREPRP